MKKKCKALSLQPSPYIMAGRLTRKSDVAKTHDTQWVTDTGFGEEMGLDLLTVSPQLQSNILNSHGTSSWNFKERLIHLRACRVMM